MQAQKEKLLAFYCLSLISWNLIKLCALTEWIGEQDPKSIFGRLHGSS